LTIIMNRIGKSPFGLGLYKHPDIERPTRALLASRSRKHRFDRFAALFKWTG